MKTKVFLIFVLLCMLMLFGCNSDDKKIVSIEVNFDTIINSYEVGEVDLSSIEITVFYFDDTKLNVPLKKSFINKADYEKLSTVGSQKIIINYKNFTTELILNIIEKDPLTAEFNYTLTFFDYNGYVLGQKIVSPGILVIPPEVPNRKGYDFLEWDTNLEEVNTDLEVTAIYLIKNYSVTFNDIEGNSIANETIDYGSAVKIPKAPLIEGYDFTGWFYGPSINSKKFTEQDYVTENLILTPKYTLSTYLVQFIDYNNDVLHSQYVSYGTSLFPPNAPNREGYIFTGWDQSFSTIVSKTTIKATYHTNAYTVLFENLDGTLLKEEIVQYEQNATAPEDPVKHGYTFISWDTNYHSINLDLIIKPVFIINSYQIIFYDYDGTILKEEQVEFGNEGTEPFIPKGKDIFLNLGMKNLIISLQVWK